MKLTKRKGFNFFRSYYDVYNELSDKDKVAFIDALFDRQFLGVKPTNLKGMAKFAYISQTNSIDSQVKGYEDKTGLILTPYLGGAVGVEKKDLTPSLQVQEKEQEKEQDVKKPKTAFVPPSKTEFMQFAKTKFPTEDAYQLVRSKLMLKYDAWSESGWINGRTEKKIKRWRETLLNTIPHL